MDYNGKWRKEFSNQHKQQPVLKLQIVLKPAYISEYPQKQMEICANNAYFQNASQQLDYNTEPKFLSHHLFYVPLF